jgi:hypothetical protein
VKFSFEGVTYFKTLDMKRNTWNVSDETGNIVGELIDTIYDSWIYWNDDYWEERHHRHDDYTCPE